MYLYVIAKIEDFHPLLLKSTLKIPGIPVHTLRNCPSVQYLPCITKDDLHRLAAAEMLSQ